ncbi:MAG TPA: nucleotide exchange factor GrpE [Candidatus Aquicultor sp.]|jgi:molecular chaperone GrpE
MVPKDETTNDHVSAHHGDTPEAGSDMAAEAPDTGTETLEELNERLAKSEAEATEYLDMLRRTQAEMDNFRKRMMKEHERVIECAAEGIVTELLPLIDNLERALDSARAGAERETLAGGVELIYSQLMTILGKQGVSVIDPGGVEFDPQAHQAVMQVESSEYGENVVAEVLQKGYELNGKLLRPAMVKVAK